MTEGELADLQARLGPNGLTALGLPCSGKLTIPYLLKAFEKGADGVVLCACPETECKNLEGNLRASRRTQAVEELVEEIGLGKGRVLMITKKEGQIEKVIDGVQKLQQELSVVYSPGTSKASRPAADVRTRVGANDRRENAA